MRSFFARPWPWTFAACTALAFAAACGSNGDDPTGAGSGDASADGTAGNGDGGATDGGTNPVPGLDGSGGVDGASCEPPDILVVLDRTLSMSAEPNGAKPPNTPAGHKLSKWYLATSAVKSVSAPPADQTARFGLEAFPLDPNQVPDAGGTGQCVTLTQELGGTSANNTSCQTGQLVVAPNLGTGSAISTILDPETFTLCISTPIASALDEATTALHAIAKPGRKQIVLLVTDGGETCRGQQSVGVAQALAAAGVQTYVVGFGTADAGASGVNVKLLNNLACAGQTATSFATACTKDEAGAGYVAVTPSGPPLFYLAEDGTALETALKQIAGSVCCGCVK